jgi:hypothetical protein
MTGKRIAAIPLTAAVIRRNPRSGELEQEGVDVPQFHELPPEASFREMARLDHLGALSLPGQSADSLRAEQSAKIDHYRAQRSSIAPEMLA